MQLRIKALSHKTLGKYLAGRYLHNASRQQIRAFLLGCTQPDKNPATYLKGSIRCKWLRGHNWNNARRFMERLARRLEKKQCLRLLDYYTMGKLIHYTVDAFTSSHNDHFPTALQIHRSYENQLQAYFLPYLKQRKHNAQTACTSIMETICFYHKEYAQIPSNIRTDSRYCVLVTSLVLCILLA